MTSTHRRSAGRLRLLAAAHDIAGRGWPVIPLHRCSKHPAITDWERNATTDPEQLARWWNAAPYNIGIACGPARLVVIDLDASHGRPPPPPWDQHGVTHGRDVLAILAARADAPVPNDTYTVATPTGGEHLYFLAPPGQQQLRNTVGQLGWHVDTRAGGGSIIAAGSIRRIDGRPRLYRVTRDRPAAPLPAWLAAALTPKPPRIREPSYPQPTCAHTDAYVQAAVRGEATAVLNATSGTRNITLFKAAARLGELVGAGLLDESTAADALLRAAEVHVGVEHFTTAEATRTIASGLTRGRSRPRHIAAAEQHTRRIRRSQALPSTSYRPGRTAECGCYPIPRI